MTTPITELSATALAHAIRTGEVTARTVVDAHIDVLERVNPTLNAVVAERFTAARAEAEAADRRIAATTDRTTLPPLLGVPCTVKESIAVTGMPNSGGVVARAATTVQHTAPVAQRLLDAGAVLLGVTNTSEMCLWIESENRVYGRTDNPYRAGHTAGGSSGGEGAAIGCGGSPIGIGSDLVGSIRTPAFCNGVFGHKPSVGLIPTTDAWPPCHGITARIMVNGPLARRAEDLLPLLRLLAGPDGRDPVARAMALGDPDTVDFDGLRVIVPLNAFLRPLAPDLTIARERAADALRRAGARVEYRAMPQLRRALALMLALLSTEVGVTSSEILAAQGAAPVRWRDLLRRNGPHTVATRLMLAGERLTALAPTPDTERLLTSLRTFTDTLTTEIGDGVMLLPTLPGPPPRHGRTVGRPWWIAPAAVFSLAGLPVTQVPLGLGHTGLPLGVQVAARPGNDHVTVATALLLERAHGGWVPPRPPRSPSSTGTAP